VSRMSISFRGQPTAAAETVSAGGRPARPARNPLGALVTAAFVAVVLVAAPQVLSDFWVQTLTSAVIYAAVALGLGLLFGRVGLISLGQIAMLALGGWTALRLGQELAAPFPVTLLLTAGITALAGVLIGLPALRLSGLHLALVTLMGAAAVTVALANINFPNGGGGFFGYNPVNSGTVPLARPALAGSDGAYLRYVIAAVALLFLISYLHVRGRPGRAWAAIRQSEPAATAAGINVTLYKLWAFALASAITGVAGGLLAASAGGLTAYQFPTQDSITLLAVVLIGGMYSFWGAIAAGFLVMIVPAILQQFGISSDVLLIVFGAGVMQSLLATPDGIAGQLPKDLRRLSGRLGRGRTGPAGAGEAGRTGGEVPR
jgi:branched-chain amino acid transport system permease protein